MRSHQYGFAMVPVVIAAALLVIIGGVGFVAYSSLTATKPTASDTKPHETSHDKEHDMNTMQSVTTTKDLDQAATSLDDPSFDNDGQSVIDDQASEF